MRVCNSLVCWGDRKKLCRRSRRRHRSLAYSIIDIPPIIEKVR
ncbi:MAG: hypothetical protein V7K97_27405 [Nostoc sp.]